MSRWVNRARARSASGSTRWDLNYIDVYFRSGSYPLPLPGGLGMEAAGDVIAVGAGVTGLAVGDRVAYVARPPGAYAQERVLPAVQVVKLPDALSYEQGASVMLQGLTAQYLVAAHVSGQGRRHDPDPGGGRRRRAARLPVGQGVGRDGDRHGRLG